ncbi:MAG: Serine-tRNA ligase [Candidatus Kaiserbacteria bacterium GW2011_GWC2_49_12]|uniref:Serine--tRNA ligase n=1 Tax=Candidatus Kaiserbacteria bacterium GW2011_GWC2_49_12 TaxID=1618675 RepID=A0A0G1VIN3_9BACT|nr:MAG: Serine-tRNA ligase [Candidatus Kaiserbacteria bacterium GW2011_GWC2_49_12]
MLLNMLDIKFIRENADAIKAGAAKKHLVVDIDTLLKTDEKRRALMQETESMRAKQNEANDKMVAANPGERSMLLPELKKLKESLQKKEEELKSLEHEWQLLMVQVPNIPDLSVPEGASDADNVEVRTWGTKPDIKNPKSHTDLMQALGMADFERGTKVAGFRGYVLKGDGALLNYAVWNFVQDHFVKKGGFTPMLVPSLVKRVAFLGTGYLPQGEEDLYKTQDGDFLAGTGEVATMAYYLNETLDKKDLPLKMLAFSPCFRREAGSHGKDTKGLMRVHEFFKFEQVVLCEASHEESVRLHEELTKNAEELLQTLNLPYHVVINCGGDLGLGQVKKYDIETWVPSENRYRETHSSSYFHDFQTRRLNIRYRDEGGVMQYAHSLNNTALATPRILISIIENNQNEDGSITVPEALRPYFGKDTISK